MQSQTPPRVYRFPDLRRLGISWSRKHVRSLELAGKFPQHFMLGENSAAWPADLVDEWLRARIRGDGPAAKKGPKAKATPPEPRPGPAA